MDLYDIISDEVEFAEEPYVTIRNFFNHLCRQKNKNNKESRYNNESEKIKNRLMDMYSLFQYLNYKCGDNIQKICASTKITKFMTVFKKLSNIVIREQKVFNSISNRLKEREGREQLICNANQYGILHSNIDSNIENIKANIRNNQVYKQHYSKNGSYGFYEYVRDCQQVNDNNNLIIQLLNIIFENIEDDKDIELYKQINIEPFLDVANMAVTGRWALKKIEESSRIQRYLIRKFGKNKDLYNNIRDEIKRINGQDMSVTGFCNHLQREQKSVVDELKNKRKINNMYSLFHNIVKQSPEVTNTKECECVKVIDLMDLLEKANQKAKYPEQQWQQQQITKQQYQKQPEPKQELEETEEEFEEFEELEEELEESACELSVSLQQQLQKPTPMLNIPSNKALFNDNTVSKMNVQLENIGQCKEVKIPCKAGCYYLLFDK